MQRSLFDELQGQKRVKQALTEAILSERIGHAYIFNGPEGIGRKSFAQRFAALIACGGQPQSGHTLQLCTNCRSCGLYRSGTNPDIRIYGATEGKSTVSVETIREMQEDTATAPQYGEYKVYIIDSGEKMTAQAQNALLKTLEEPPQYVVIIIICANYSQLLDTVQSRAVKIDFARNSDEEIQSILREKAAESKYDLLLAQTYADGVPGRALEFVKSDSDIEYLRKELLRIMEERGSFADILEKNSARREFMMFTLTSYYRDIAVCARYGNTAKKDMVPLQNECFRQRLYDMSVKIGYHKAIKSIEAVNEAWRQLMRNVNAKLALNIMDIELRREAK